jgi:hypothetical protein
MPDCLATFKPRQNPRQKLKGLAKVSRFFTPTPAALSQFLHPRDPARIGVW